MMRVMRISIDDIKAYIEDVEVIFKANLNCDVDSYGFGTFEFIKETNVDLDNARIKIGVLRELKILSEEEYLKVIDYFDNLLTEFKKNGGIFNE